MSTRTSILEHDVRRVGRTAVVLIVAIVVAVVLNTAVAAVAVVAGAPQAYPPLTLPVYGSFTAVGVIAGWIGWRTVQRRAAHPRRVLAVLVPVVGILSFIPDVLLLTLRFIPGTTPVGGIALMTMHVVVIAVAVPAYALATRPARADA